MPSFRRMVFASVAASMLAACGQMSPAEKLQADAKQAAANKDKEIRIHNFDQRYNTRYSVSRNTGLCFSETGDANWYSHSWVPCTEKVIVQLPPELRQYADTKTGIAPPAP